MSNMQKDFDNEQSISSEKKIFKDKHVNNTQEIINNHIVSHRKKLIDNKEILLNTDVNITVELGKSKIKIKDFLSFSKGSMLILDKLAKDPLDIFMNGHLIASGEIVVLEKKYGLRITSIKNSFKNTKNSV